ncbi:MAG: trehalose-phosphatase [Betaproteobacteria bacterium RIFCSPLOWO2_12_FULL_65_14]|nr:MAG: trehalose-phosphatase [Betaproteobacteria bacterium RIFCSPLOWO2_12_FULL_65_14]
MPPLRADWAFFLDIDGTLLDIEQRPEAVRVEPRELELVSALHRAAGGALALASGRPLAGIDVLFHPLKLPIAGQHGAERRDARGERHRHRFPVKLLQRAANPVRQFAAANQGLIFEDKGASVALHYRLAPQLAAAAEAVVREAAQSAGGALQMQPGKMVFELKPAGCDKGSAIEEFMRDAPFAGRTPVFLGDDVTDEHGFRVVNRLNGHSVKIGGGPTAARWRLAGPEQARAWLGEWLKTYG